MGLKTRLYLLLAFFYLVGSLILVRLFYLQVISYEELVAAAEKQHLTSFEVPASRGRIMAADGFPLVVNKGAFLVYASLPDLKETPEKIADRLAPMIATPSAQADVTKMIKDRLERKNLVWVSLKNGVEPKVKEEIESFKIGGIGFEEEEERGYPEGSSAAHLLGFVGSDASGKDKGYFGVEGYYDRQLMGRSGRKILEKDAQGRPILVGGFGEEKSDNGRDLILFLDRTIQYLVENRLRLGIEKYGAKAGSVAVMDPKTGGILAMASYPSYEPGNFSQYEAKLYKNPVVADLFEPGSILKPLIMSAALNEKLVTPQTKCDRCDGPRVIGEYTINTFNNKYHPDSTMEEVLENSDNTGMVFVAEKLGSSKLYDYFKSYGLGEKTGIDLEEETTSEIRPKDEWRPIDLATASFGQGIALTRLQILRAFAAIANQGKLPKPIVVKEILTPGKVVTVESETVRQVIKPAVAEALTEMLVSVTEKSPLHFPRDRIPELNGYRIAAKSGTAQIPVAGHYDPNKTIGSVVGFAPADNPRFVVLVSLVEPSVRPWGSDTAGPIFFEIIKELFLYYGIQP